MVRQAEKGKEPINESLSDLLPLRPLEFIPTGNSRKWCSKHTSKLSGPRGGGAEGYVPVPISN